MPGGSALRRAGAAPGDVLFVSGTPGDAAAGLALEQGRLAAAPEASAYLRERFLRPQPRLALGERLRGYASACIDVSDGLLGGCRQAGRGERCGRRARLERRCPCRNHCASRSAPSARGELALTGGDDYELCFAVHA